MHWPLISKSGRFGIPWKSHLFALLGFAKFIEVNEKVFQGIPECPAREGA